MSCSTVSRPVWHNTASRGQAMYDWLNEALHDSGTIVTANRRLARVLTREYAAQRRSSGAKAWRSPKVFAWQDWLQTTINGALETESVATRINVHQSQWLWERCWRQEIGDNELNVTSLVKLSRDSWQRMADWQVSIREVARSSQSVDQRAFAAVAGRYAALLQRQNMMDDAGLGARVQELIADGRVHFAGQHTFAGFDRQRPLATAIHKALVGAGVDVSFAPLSNANGERSLRAFENTDAEFRSAGAWARRRLERDPAAAIAIVATGLDADADGIARCVREGAVPGWQYGHRSLADAVNVSYGRRLSEYPAIAIALILLRWLVSDLGAKDVSLLLRSPLLANPDVAGRGRLELKLRQLPDRAWSPSMIISALGTRDDEQGNGDWLSRLRAFNVRRRALAKRASPAEWAVVIDATLTEFGWPGAEGLGSAEFQLINRWRELLNEFARLRLVAPKLAPGVALARVQMMAGDTVFQAESGNATVQLMGPLEASGAQFDAVWVAGLTANNCPPRGAPSVLLSRRLQEKYGMPDCAPEDTLRYAEQVLSRLLGSAKTAVCSFAVIDDDAEQTASALLASLDVAKQEPGVDPGWHATTLIGAVLKNITGERVPAVTAGEKISGGAAAVQRQLADPISAFVQSRMSARIIQAQAVGVPALLRGNLIHDALQQLYGELPSSENLRRWQDDDITARIDAALTYAFARHQRNADAVLRQLLVLERHRIADLLRQFVAVDRARDPFTIASVEGSYEFVAGNIRLPLRFDRLDRFDDGSIAILDYKTGAKKTLVTAAGEARQIQLFVYASATKETVSALALVNIDSREICFDGAGRGYTDTDAWPALLQRIKGQIAVACEELAVGDVRINIEQGLQVARPLNLLTRYTELRRDNG